MIDPKDLKDAWFAALENTRETYPGASCTNADWTKFVGSVYVELAHRQTWYVCYKRPPGQAADEPRQGEFLGIDALFFEKDAHDLDLPLLAIEHQNIDPEDNVGRLSYCLWKLSVVRVPRILIGYASKTAMEPTRQALAALMQQRGLADGIPTMLVLGKEPSPESDAWTDYYSFWLWSSGSEAFEPI